MSRRARQYRHLIDQALSDVRRQDALHRFGDAYLAARAEAFADLDFESLRHDIAAMKDTVRDDWPHQLEKFMQQAAATGAKVFLAQDAKAANTYITDLAQRHDARLAVKSKSMAGEEIALNHALEGIGMRGGGNRPWRMDRATGRSAPEPHGHAGHSHVSGSGG